MQWINICDDSFNRKMSPLTSQQSVIERVAGSCCYLPVHLSPLWNLKVKVWASHWLAICRGIRESLETMIGRNGVWSEKYSMTRRCKALFRDCYCRDGHNVGSVVVVSDPTITMRLSDKDFQFMKDDIKCVKYSLVFCYYINILMLKK